MRAVAHQKVRDRICALIGVPWTSLSTADKSTVDGFINEEAEQCWEFYWWPELMLSELRFYRDDYSAGTAYVTGNEVYYATTGKYYTALGATTGNAPTNATYWVENTDIDAYIELEQAGETEIGAVRLVSPDDPLTTQKPRKLPYVLGQNGIHLVGASVPDSAYVWFRKVVSEYVGADFDAVATYTAGAVKYYASANPGFEGDYWECLATTTAGEDPEDTPLKWSKIEFPKVLLEPVARAVHYRYLLKDGGTEAQIGIARSDARDALTTAMHKYVGQQASAA